MILSKLLCFFSLIFFSYAAFSAETVKVGVTSGPTVKVMQAAKKLAKEKYDLDIIVSIYTNYRTPNDALNAGDIDANIFQTRSFLKQTVSKLGYKIVEIGQTFIYPMGIFSKKIKNINEIAKGAKIAIPSDPSNQGRALNLLNEAGLIELKKGAGETPVVKDIIKNPKNIGISLVDAAFLAQTSKDVTAVVLNNDFVATAGFKPEEALFQENPDSADSYVNIIVVKENEKGKKVFEKLRSVMNSDEVLKETKIHFPGAVKAWK